MDIETAGLIVGSLSIVAATLGLLLTAFIFYRVREDIRTINQIQNKQREFEKKVERSNTISNELVNVLYDLYSMSSGYKAMCELQSLNVDVDDALFNSLNEDFENAEKHFAELGLFSADFERRISVAQSLANSYGDMQTYTLLNDLENGSMGLKFPELKPYRIMLGDRLGGVYKSRRNIQSPSDIRTDGGAF